MDHSEGMQVLHLDRHLREIDCSLATALHTAMALHAGEDHYTGPVCTTKGFL